MSPRAFRVWADARFPVEDRRAQLPAHSTALLVPAAVGDQNPGQMKLTTDNGRLLIEPDGNDSPVVNDMHVLQGWVLVMADAAVVEI